MWKVGRKGLVISASAVSLLGGLQVLNVGIRLGGGPAGYAWPGIGVSLAAAVVFGCYIFPPVVRRNVAYVCSLSGVQPLYRCFKLRSWGLISGMILLGIALKRMTFIPGFVLSGFYIGIGIALLSAVNLYYRMLPGISLDSDQ